MSTSPHPICDYEGSRYREEFWVGQGREYEDLVERIALSRLLPARGRRLLEIGAGFGRLADLYVGYEEVVLLDYSHSLLDHARSTRVNDPRFAYVVANLYHLPFPPCYFDAIVMVRVIHHVVDVPLALREVQRVLAGNGCFILEFANKRHLKSIARYLLGRQTWSPFDREPYEFVKLNFDFHPAWMEEQLRAAGLEPERVLALSFFRLPLLKRAIPYTWLARADQCLQPAGAWWKLTPSLMLRCRQARPLAQTL